MSKNLNNVPFLCTKGFQKRGHYSRGDIIQGRTLFKEMRQLDFLQIAFDFKMGNLETRTKLANVNTLQDVVELIRNSKKIIILTGKKNLAIFDNFLAILAISAVFDTFWQGLTDFQYIARCNGAYQKFQKDHYST